MTGESTKEQLGHFEEFMGVVAPPKVTDEGVFQHTLSDDAWRKLYAGLAMEGGIAHYGCEGYAEAAEMAFKQADAMLAESKRTEAKPC